MEETVKINELFALIFRRWKTVICLALIFAVLLGGVQAAKQFLEVQKARAEAEKQEAITSEKEQLTQQLSSLEDAFEAYRQYCENSPLLEIDPYNVIVTNLYFSIVVENRDTALSEEYDPDYVVSNIENQYLAFFAGMDLESVVEQSAGVPLADRYLREVISFGTSTRGVLTVKVIGSQEITTQRIAQAVLTYLEDQKQAVSDCSYPHDLVLLSNETKTVWDMTLKNTQKSLKDAGENLSEQIDLTREQLEKTVELWSPSATAVITAVARYVIFGLILGLVLGISYVMASSIFTGSVVSSRQMESKLSVCCLGSVAAEKKRWQKTADKIQGEQGAQKLSLTQEYLCALVQLHLKQGEAVALLSSLAVDEQDSAIQSIIQALHNHGIAVHFAADASCNAYAVSALQKASCVILAERLDVSRWGKINGITALAQNLQLPLLGFVTI